MSMLEKMDLIDLIITALKEQEKRASYLLNKLEKIVERLEKEESE